MVARESLLEPVNASPEGVPTATPGLAAVAGVFGATTVDGVGAEPDDTRGAVVVVVWILGAVVEVVDGLVVLTVVLVVLDVVVVDSEHGVSPPFRLA
jgi:hypothetical protein